MADKPIEDCIGQWLNVDDVITHANRAGSQCWLDVGVITRKNEDGSINWVRVEGLRWGWRGDPVRWATKTTTLHRTDLCTKLNLTRQQLIAKLGLPAEIEESEEDLTKLPSRTFHRPLPAEEFELIEFNDYDEAELYEVEMASDDGAEYIPEGD